MSVRNDLGLYERHAEHWWDRRSPVFRSLHAVHEFRLRQVRAWWGERLQGATVVDLGCGGGLLSEPLAASAARMLGIDVSAASLRSARGRSRQHPEGGGRLYARGDVTRAPLRDGCADLVLCCDVLEHVADFRAVLAEGARLLQRDGLLYVNTINRSRSATVLAVWLAEGLRLVPPGTHDPALFVRPSELEEAAAAAGLEVVRMAGESPRVFTTLRRWAITLRPSRNLRIGYSALLRRR